MKIQKTILSVPALAALLFSVPLAFSSDDRLTLKDGPSMWTAPNIAPSATGTATRESMRSSYPEHYLKRSPISLAGNVKTPTMILTGEVDYRTGFKAAPGRNRAGAHPRGLPRHRPPAQLPDWESGAHPQVVRSAPQNYLIFSTTMVTTSAPSRFL